MTRGHEYQNGYFRRLMAYDWRMKKNFADDALAPQSQEVPEFIGFLDGAAERDRTADLVNAIHGTPGVLTPSAGILRVSVLAWGLNRGAALTTGVLLTY
jgi:hypothetical protein